MLKILVVQNNLDNHAENVLLPRIIEDYKRYFVKTRKLPYDLEITYLNTNLARLSHKEFRPNLYGLKEGVKDQLRPLIKENEYQRVIFMYDLDKTDGGYGKLPVTAWNYWNGLYSHTGYIEMPVTPTSINSGWVLQSLVHESMHSDHWLSDVLGVKTQDTLDWYDHNEDIYHPTGNYARNYKELVSKGAYTAIKNYIATKTTPKMKEIPYVSDDWVAKLIQAFKALKTAKTSDTDPIVPKALRYFSQKEVNDHKLTPELWQLLDNIRHECGFPFVITSGRRSEAKNSTLKNAVEDSAHITGEAADIYCISSSQREKINTVRRKHGVRRIGIGRTFVHLDIDKSKPQDVMWHYY